MSGNNIHFVGANENFVGVNPINNGQPRRIRINRGERSSMIQDQLRHQQLLQTPQLPARSDSQHPFRRDHHNPIIAHRGGHHTVLVNGRIGIEESEIRTGEDVRRRIQPSRRAGLTGTPPTRRNTPTTPSPPPTRSRR